MSAIPRFDFHIHTKYLGCANGTMEIPAIIKECERLGVTKLGITDHLNTIDKLGLHDSIKKDIAESDTNIEVYFGVELNFLGIDSEFACDQALMDKYGFQFAIGGIHSTYLETYDLKKIVDIQHRHHLKTCRDPMIDVLVHPYWFAKGHFDRNGWPWFDSMKPVPKSYARELGRTAKETGTAIEINASANLVGKNYSERYVKEYIEFLAVLAEEGASFSVGSDAHDIKHLADISAAWDVAEQLGLSADRVWRPKCRPFKQA